MSTESADASAASPTLPQLTPAHIACSRGLPDWLRANHLSLAFTSYQTGRLYLVGVDEAQRLAIHEVGTGRAMGLWADPQRLVLATPFQVWRFENVLAADQSANGADRYYVPRVAHTTGELDIHDVGVLGDGRIVFVNTLYSCLSLLSPVHAFRVFWKPSFITKLAAEDRCHLNGLAVRDGEAAFVTATSRSDVVNGWRARRAEGGVVIDVASGAIVTEKLSMPHSPRWHQNQLWVLNSGSGHLGTVDLASGNFAPRAFCPGFLRGLAFHNGHAVVGLSLSRDGSFSGLALDDELKKRDADGWCGLQIVNLGSGDIVQWIRIEGAVTELYDVAVLPGVRRPMAASFTGAEIAEPLTFEA
ncbi:TIGR03032 family protein [Bradyrhizobium sp.]|uniref:TIGR03032 family protein n=1 Tax=Bradyrhizobium sp. TaxID=376 RepID=UPI003C66CCBD